MWSQALREMKNIVFFLTKWQLTLIFEITELGMLHQTLNLELLMFNLMLKLEKALEFFFLNKSLIFTNKK